MRRKSSEVLTRLTTIALLSALGFVLMAFVRFPYPIAPWLMIEFSDVVVLISYALYGFPGAISVSILKTALDLAVNGITGVYGIGNITALLTSLTFTLGLFITSHLFHFFKKGIGFRILAYVLMTIFTSILLTFFNALFITPTYLTGEFTTCFNSDAVKKVIEGIQSFGISGNSYFYLIFIIYFPFNLMKGAIISFLYELLFNRLIFVLMERSPMMKKYFLGPILKEKKKEEKIEEKEEK